jgi:hypothetical protein
VDIPQIIHTQTPYILNCGYFLESSFNRFNFIHFLRHFAGCERLQGKKQIDSICLFFRIEVLLNQRQKKSLFSNNTKILTKKLPVWYWAILVFGIVTIAMVVGVFLIIWFFWLVYNHFQNRVQVKEEYGMIIEMNSGSSSVLLGSKKEFILEVIYDLYEILNAEESKPMLFDFSHNVMNDSSINVREAVNAALISGKVIGGVSTQSS